MQQRPHDNLIQEKNGYLHYLKISVKSNICERKKALVIFLDYKSIISDLKLKLDF